MSGISKLIPSHARLATKFVVNALIGMHSTGTWFRSVVIIEANNTFVLHKIILILHKHSLRLQDETMTQLLFITVFLLYVYALWSRPLHKIFTMYVPLHVCVTIIVLILTLQGTTLKQLDLSVFCRVMTQ